MLSKCQGCLRCDCSLQRRIVCKGEEHRNVIKSTCFLERIDEVLGNIVFDTHGSKDDCEIALSTADLSLTHNLGCKLVMLHTVSGEDRKLLALDKCHHSIDYRYTGLDEVPRILTGCRIHRNTIHIPLIFSCRNLRTIARLSETIHDTAKHLLCDTERERLSKEVHPRIRKVESVRSLEALYTDSFI